jgi:hypothetical protein
MHNGNALLSPYCHSVLEYLDRHKCALVGDLFYQGFKKPAIEDDVNDSPTHIAPWPLTNPRTHLFWLPEAQGHLEHLY